MTRIDYMTERADNIAKREVQTELLRNFGRHGMVGLKKSAGAVPYFAIRVNEDSHQNAAAIYGGQGTPASVWVKDSVFQSIKEGLKSAGVVVDDVSYTHRGFDWRIHIEAGNSAVADLVVGAVKAHGESRWNHYMENQKKKAELEARRAERKARMDAIKKDPFA